MNAAKSIPMFPVSNNPLEQNEPIPGGYYLKARCIQNSAIASAAPHVREVWDWLLKEANYKDNKTFGVIIQRGQIFTDYNEIINALSWKEGFIKKSYKKHHVDYAMRWLRQELMITTQKTTRGLIITVCNYERYQDASNYEKATGYDTVTTRLRQPAATIQKNSKEYKESNEEIESGARAPAPKFTKPDLVMVEAFFTNENAGSEAQRFFDYYSSNGWKVGRNPMKDWKAAARNWINKSKTYQNGTTTAKRLNQKTAGAERLAAEIRTELGFASNGE